MTVPSRPEFAMAVAPPIRNECPFIASSESPTALILSMNILFTVSILNSLLVFGSQNTAVLGLSLFRSMPLRISM